MRSVLDIFALWPSDAELGRDIGLRYNTVSAWKQRGSIPGAYWRDLVRAAQRRGHFGVTAEILADLHARKTIDQVQSGFGERERTELEATYSPPAENRGAESPAPAGQFSRWKHLRRSHFSSPEGINQHIRALREEWDRR